MELKILIIGGTGAFGMRYAKLFSQHGFDVAITGRDEKKGRKKAEENELKFIPMENGLSDSDVVIVSVPISKAPSLISDLRGKCKKDALLMDFTSVKTHVAKELEKAECAEACSCHPMHGPRVSSLEGQTIIFIPIKTGKKYAEIRKFFEERKARIVESTADEHDRMLAVVQSLTHFMYLSFSSTLRAKEIGIGVSRKFATSLYDISLDLVYRIVGQNPHIYSQIQVQNPYSSEMEQEFARQCERISGIVKARDEKAFVDMFREAAKHMGEPESALARTDKLISAAKEEIRELKEKLGEFVAVQNIYSDKIHYGILKKVDTNESEIERNGKTTTLKTDKIRVLKGSELNEWKKENSVSRDFSFLFPECDPGEVKNASLGISGDIVSAELIDTYELPQGISVTLRFAIFGEADVKKIEKLIKKRYIGLGGKLR